MVLRTQNNLDLGPAQSAMSAAANLMVEAGRARGAGMEGLLGGLAGGVKGYVGRKDDKRREATQKEQFQATLDERRANRLEDNARADRAQANVEAHQKAALAVSRLGDLDKELAQATLDQDAERIQRLTQERAGWSNILGDTLRNPSVVATGQALGMIPAAPGAAGSSPTTETMWSQFMAIDAKHSGDKAPGAAGAPPPKVCKDGSCDTKGGEAPLTVPGAAPTSAVGKGGAPVDYLGAAGVTLPDASPLYDAYAKAQVALDASEAKLRKMTPGSKGYEEELKAKVRNQRDVIAGKAAVDAAGKVASAAQEKAQKDAADRQKAAREASIRVGELRHKLAAYQASGSIADPGGKRLTEMAMALANPNNDVKDVDLVIDQFFPGAKDIHDAKSKAMADAAVGKKTAGRTESDMTPKEIVDRRAEIARLEREAGLKTDKPDTTVFKAENDEIKAKFDAVDDRISEWHRSHPGEAFDPKEKGYTDLVAAKERVVIENETLRQTRVADAKIIDEQGWSPAEKSRFNALPASERKKVLDRLRPKGG